MAIKAEDAARAVRVFKILAALATKNWLGAAMGAADLAVSLIPPPKEGDAGEQADTLLRRAALRAALSVIEHHAHLAEALAKVDPKSVEGDIKGAGLAVPPLTASAFTDIGAWDALPKLRELFAFWLRACRVDEAAHAPLSRAFIESLPGALRDETLDHAGDYTALDDWLNRATRFDPVVVAVENWRKYRQTLIADVRKPHSKLLEDFPDKAHLSLRDLYIPLRATWVEHPAPDPARGFTAERAATAESKTHLVWLGEALREWIAAAKPNDPVRVVTGEPGGGKSTACKMLAAELAAEGRRVVLVPLGRLNYNTDAWEALRVWSNSEIGHDVFDEKPVSGDEPLVLILDGLDELVKAGEVGKGVVTRFTNALYLDFKNRNRSALNILLLLAGRPGATQAADALGQADAHRLTVRRFVLDDDLPFTVRESDLGKLDQRDEWWRAFGYPDGLPEPLREAGKRYDGITAHPLLNWLLAQSWLLAPFDPKTTVGGVYALYERLLRQVLMREHREVNREGTDGTTGSLPESAERLARLLEEVAIAAWHDGDRSIAFATIEERLKSPELMAELRAICADNHEAAIATVLDSFFCAERAGGGHHSVEFTHKSFREFLTARRLVREVVEHHALLSQFPSWDKDGLLAKWLALCGPTAIDRDLLAFIRDAMAFHGGADPDRVKDWRDTLHGLFQATLDNGLPLPVKVDRTHEVTRQSRNAMEALFAIHHACVLVLVNTPHRELTRFKWGPDDESAAAVLHFMTDTWARWRVIGDCLSHLDLENKQLITVNLFGANLSYANLSGADLYRADLTGSNLCCAWFRKAELFGSNLTDADLAGADLSDADLSFANVSRANLSLADLTGADLSRADLSFANISDANLSFANLSGARLDGVSGLSDEELADLRRRAGYKDEKASE